MENITYSFPLHNKFFGQNKEIIHLKKKDYPRNSLRNKTADNAADFNQSFVYLF